MNYDGPGLLSLIIIGTFVMVLLISLGVLPQ